MAGIDLGKPYIERVSEFPLDVEFSYCDGNAPRDVEVQIRAAASPIGCGKKLHQFKSDDHIIQVGVPEEMASELCHGLHYIDILLSDCIVCTSKPVFLDYSCAQPDCDISVVRECGTKVKCNV